MKHGPTHGHLPPGQFRHWLPRGSAVCHAWAPGDATTSLNRRGSPVTCVECLRVISVLRRQLLQQKEAKLELQISAMQRSLAAIKAELYR